MTYPPVIDKGQNDRVCFDFDDTLAESIWPDSGIGAPIPEGLEMLTHYQDKGYRVFIWTSRPWWDHHDIEQWIWMHLGNERARVVQVVCGKLLAGLYVDDLGYRFERTGVEEEEDPSSSAPVDPDIELQNPEWEEMD